MQEFEWQIDMPLLNNRFLLYDLCKVVVITGVVFFLLLTGISLATPGRFKLETLADLAKITGLGMLGLLILLVLVCLLFFFNYFPMRFQLSPKGALVESMSTRGKWGNRLAVVLGALSGKPGVAGAGLLGMSQETVSLEWPEVYRLKVHPEVRVISLLNSWRVVFRLYCTPDNFGEVLASVQEWVEQGQKVRERAARRAIPTVWLPQVLLSLATVAAGIFLAALPLKVPAALKMAVTLTGLLLVWLPWRRFLGAAVLVLAASLALLFLGQALETRQLFQEADVPGMGPPGRPDAGESAGMGPVQEAAI